MRSAQVMWVRGAVVSVVVGALAVFGPRVVGQQVLGELKLPGEFGPIGHAVGHLGDVSGDGVSDLLVAGPVGTFVKSGAGGATLAFASNGNELPLAVHGVGDLDGDGTADFVTATEETIRACSGADGELLWSVPAGNGSNFKAAVRGLGDVSGDGVPDVAVSESQVPGFPQVRTFSGADGGLLYGETHTAFAMDTVEWDGSPGLELVVGDPDFLQSGSPSGRVRVIEPVGGATLATFMSGNDDRIGRSVASLNDVSGDGVPDIIASSSVIQGTTTVWSGATGGIFYEVPSNHAFHLERVGDVTGDGKAEFVGGGPGGGAGGFGSGQLRNGATGALIQQINLFGELNSFRSFTGPGDLNGNGVPDLLVSSAGGPFGGTPSARELALPAGTLILQIVNPAGDTLLGRAADQMGDLDGDGQGDFVLASTAGAAVFAADGEVLVQVDSVATSLFGVGANVVAGPGDVDGDDVPDMALANAFAGSSFQGRVALFSGADGSEITVVSGEEPSTQLGMAIVDVPDRNGDGVRDLYVGAPAFDIEGVQSVGEVRLLSGADLSLLSAFHGEVQNGELFGWTLDAGGDLDQDGVVDVIVGARGGAVYVFSGATELELARQVSTAPTPDLYGSFVGDADGDGVEDYLAREPYYDDPAPGLAPVGRVRLYSGDGGLLLWTQVGTVVNGLLGLNACGAGDVNGDGFADVAYTEQTQDVEASSGTVWVRSGPTGAVLDQYELPPHGTNSTTGALVAAGLVDAGGCGDLLACIPTLGNNGGAHILASSQGGVHGFIDLGFGKPGEAGFTPKLRGYGNLAAGGQVTIKVRDIKTFTNGAWFIGINQGNLPFKQGVLVPSPVGAFFQFLVGSGPIGQITVFGNNGPAVFAGLSIYHQFWFVDAAATAGLSASNGMKEIFK